MNILIKGMTMPTSCWDCEVGGAKQMDNTTCPFYSMEYWEQENYQDKIADGCPLVELPPHGRLGDLDELHKEAVRRSEKTGNDSWYNCMDRVISAFDIENAPTIIPAEKSEE